VTDEELRALASRLDRDCADWQRALSYLERAELRLYQGTGYLTINALLRDEVSAAAPDAERLARIETSIEVIDGAIAKGQLQSDLVVYRGLRDPDAVFGVSLAALRDKIINEPAYTSTSLDPEVALRMTVTAPAPVLVELHLSAGQQAAWLALAGERRRRSEYELLLPRRLRIKISGVDVRGSVRLIRGTVVP
jgi:hypothetical protein